MFFYQDKNTLSSPLVSERKQVILEKNGKFSTGHVGFGEQQVMWKFKQQK